MTEVEVSTQSLSYPLITVLLTWVLLCSHDLLRAVVRIIRWTVQWIGTGNRPPLPSMFLWAVVFDLLMIASCALLVLHARNQYKWFIDAAPMFLNFIVYALGPLKVDIYTSIAGFQVHPVLCLPVAACAFLALFSRLGCGVVDLPLSSLKFDQSHHHYWRIGLTIPAIVLTSTPTILFSLIFEKILDAEKENAANIGDSQKHTSDVEEAVKAKEAQVILKHATIYTTFKIMSLLIILLSLVLTGLFFRNTEFPEIRCICANNAIVNIARLVYSVSSKRSAKANKQQLIGKATSEKSCASLSSISSSPSLTNRPLSVSVEVV